MAAPTAISTKPNPNHRWIDPGYGRDDRKSHEHGLRDCCHTPRRVFVQDGLPLCAALIDHCEGNLIIKRGLVEGKDGETWFWEERDGRRWLRNLLIKEGENDTRKGKACLVDIVRKFHPERKGMHTCWNTKYSARDSNYGTPHIKRSEHCPVHVDFHDEIVNEDGVVLKLRDLLSGAGDTKADPPRLAARYWDEYSGKRKLLSSFFGGKKAAAPSSSPTPTTTQEPVASTTVVLEQAGPSSLTSEPLQATTGTQQPPREQAVSPTCDSSTPDLPLKASEPSNATQSQSKRKRVSPKPSPVKASKIQPSNKPAKKPKPGQPKLSTFFSQPGSSGSTSNAKGKGKERSISKTALSQSATRDESEDVDMLLQETEPHEDAEDLEDADYRLALELSSSQVSLSSPSSSQKQEEAGDTWKSLMAPIQPPHCTVHNEVAKEFTVNKPRVNEGDKFCVLKPVGPGYDKGRVERLREDVDPQYKCNFFKWSSDVRREMRQGG
ncbi:Class II abasic (AP) endonuclease [Marasmius tenuissimus]|nr:Class II abasic (AP) endonuclease [Marasmius tenuissimus]